MESQARDDPPPRPGHPGQPGWPGNACWSWAAARSARRRRRSASAPAPQRGHLADNGIVSPGILVRQPYQDADIGQYKAIVLAWRLNQIHGR